jgi:hypothetical protein
VGRAPAPQKDTLHTYVPTCAFAKYVKQKVKVKPKSLKVKQKIKTSKIKQKSEVNKKN